MDCHAMGGGAMPPMKLSTPEATQVAGAAGGGDAAPAPAATTGDLAALVANLATALQQAVEAISQLTGSAVAGAAGTGAGEVAGAEGGGPVEQAKGGCGCSMPECFPTPTQSDTVQQGDVDGADGKDEPTGEGDKVDSGDKVEQAADEAPAKTHTVVAGDTLSKIARENGTTWQAIYELNKDQIDDPDLIFPGQQLKLPGGGTTSGGGDPAPPVSDVDDAAPPASETDEADTADDAAETDATDEARVPERAFVTELNELGERIEAKQAELAEAREWREKLDSNEINLPPGIARVELENQDAHIGRLEAELRELERERDALLEANDIR